MIFSEAGEPSHCSSSHAACWLGECVLIESMSPFSTVHLPAGPAGNGRTPIGNLTSDGSPAVIQSPFSIIATLPLANSCWSSLLLAAALVPRSEPGAATWYLYMRSARNWKVCCAAGVLNATVFAYGLLMIFTPFSARYGSNPPCISFVAAVAEAGTQGEV